MADRQFDPCQVAARVTREGAEVYQDRIDSAIRPKGG
jgi:hypothetical protein